MLAETLRTPTVSHGPDTAEALYRAVADWFATPRTVLVLTHLRPDGDAMGSALGLSLALRALGHDARPVFCPAVPDYLAWMPDAANATVVAQDAPADTLTPLLAAADTLACLDFGVLDRSGPFTELVRQAGKPVLHLDHHIDFEAFGHFVLRDPAASSTCELVLRLLRGAFPQLALDQAVATCLYTGIMTDTGSFRFDSTTPAVHRAVAQLLETGLQVGSIHHRIFSNFSEQRTRFLGHCLVNRLRVLPELRTAYIVVTAADQADFRLHPGDTEGLVNYALGIQGVNLGVLLMEYPDQIRMSFRSVGQFSAQAFAHHFAGGGHYNAAGGRSTESLAATEARLLALLQAHAHELQYDIP